MWITHPQTGKCMRTDDAIKVRCDICLQRNPLTKPTTRIKLVEYHNKTKLVCLDHLHLFKRYDNEL